MEIGTGSISLALSFYLSFPLISCTTLNWYSNPSVTKTKKNSLSLDYSFHCPTRVCVCVCVCIETINASCLSELVPFRASIFLAYYYLSGFVFVFFLQVSSPLNRRRALILVSNGCSAHTVGVSVGVLFMVICVRVFLFFYLQTIHRSSCYALSLFLSNKIFLFSFSNTLFLSFVFVCFFA